MRRTFLPLCLLALPCLSLARPDAGPPDGIVTLWSHDDLRSSFNFVSGGHGASVVDGELLLTGTQIVFGVFAADQVTYGYVEREQALVLDLGEQFVPPDPRPLDKAPKPPLSIYTTLCRQRNDLVYQAPNGRTIRIAAAEGIFQTLPEGPRSFTPQLGHIYVLRARASLGESGHDVIVKFQVIGFQPGQSVTLRWATL